MRRFRADFLISIIREPVGWSASIKRQSFDGKHVRYVRDLNPYAGFDRAEQTYLANVASISLNRDTFGDRFLLLDYTTLAEETEATMRAVAERIGIDWHPVLTQQTFNGMPASPNTSFPKGDRTEALSEEEIRRIEDGEMMKVYRKLAQEALN